jgi:glucosamine 6-phosphate synthetase-like amidotransferase/phosphosugar isomerase protein
MCGIFGIINYGNITYSKAESYRNAVRALLVASQIRGTDAAGICVVTQDRTAVFKDRVKAEFLIRQANYSNIVGQIHQNKGFRAVIGHTRSQTKGDRQFNVNNHPIVAGDIIGVHNGMISNDDMLFNKYKDKIQRAGRVDSEIIFRLIDMFIKEGQSITDATKQTIGMIFGSANCAFINTKNLKYVTIFSGYGVPVWIYGHVNTMVFASSKEILSRATREAGGVLNPQYRTGEFEVSGGLSRIDTDTGKVYSERVSGFGWGSSSYGNQRACNNCQLSSYGCCGDEEYCNMMMYGGI